MSDGQDKKGVDWGEEAAPRSMTVTSKDIGAAANDLIERVLKVHNDFSTLRADTREREMIAHLAKVVTYTALLNVSVKQIKSVLNDKPELSALLDAVAKNFEGEMHGVSIAEMSAKTPTARA